MFDPLKKILRLKRLSYISFFNLFVVSLLAISVVGYIVFLKSSVTKPVFLMASIQRPEWWQSTSQVPTELLSEIKEGTKDSSHDLEVEEIKYFIAQEPSWDTNSKDRSIGRVQLKVNANERNEKIYYQGQEILVGNPFVITVENTRLELLVTKISAKKINYDYKPITILVKIYSKYPEQINGIDQGMELKDNNGVAYAKITKTFKEPAKITTTDQYGIPHSQRDPLKYDFTMEVQVLAREENSRIVGYDGRTIAIGKAFVLNSPHFDDVGGWIMGIN